MFFCVLHAVGSAPWHVPEQSDLEREPFLDIVSELDAPEALENVEEFVALDSEVPELALEMPTKAVVAIQGLAEGWVGGRGRSDHTSEAGVVALLKRVRGDLNRYKLQAADTLIDLLTDTGEVREAIAPVIGQFAHEVFLATGALPEP